MKNFKSKSLLIVFITMLAFNFSISKEITYKLSLENLKNTSANSLEFDIYLQHTNPADSKFSYMLGQYFMNFNSAIANGGTLTFSIIGSELPQASIPTNASTDKDILRMAVNSIPPTDNLPVISSKAPGTLIAKVRLSTSAKSFADVSLNLSLRLGPVNPYTKVSTFEDGKIVDITLVGTGETDELSGSNKLNSSIPKQYSLLQNYPNPFNPETKINFDIPDLANVKLSIYDVTGRELSVLVNEKLEAGTYSYKWNGSGFASGIYFYRVSATGGTNDFVQTKKMVLLK